MGSEMCIRDRVLAMNEFRSAVKPSLLHVLQRTRNAQCTDPRDAVYAKLALAGDASRIARRPDYSISIADLLCRITSMYIAGQGILYTICLAQPSDGPLPSWVVDWTAASVRRPIYAELLSSTSLSVTRTGTPRCIVEEPRNILLVDGTIIDTLGKPAKLAVGYYQAQTTPFSGLDEAHSRARQQATQALQTIASTLIAGQRCPLNNTDPDDARLILTLLGVRAARLFGHKGPEPGYSYIFRWKDGLSHFDRWCLENRRLPIHGQRFDIWIAEWFWAVGSEACEWVLRYRRHEITRVLEGYESCAEMMLHGRIVLPSLSGRAVLVPSHARAGDLVCILFECPVPVVLRRVDDHYILVGECYVDDFFNGNGFDLLDEEASDELRFNIR